MKAFQLNVAKVFAIICCASIGIVEVSGTAQKHKASDGREYLIETEYQYNWFEAQHECARRDSQLVIIDSEEKNTAIVNLLKKVIGRSHNLWLGGNDEFSSSTDRGRPFFWSTTGQKFPFTYWADGQPDNKGNQEHCVHIWYSNPLYPLWNDNVCSAKLGFICEDNYHVDSCNRKLKTECNTVDKFNSDVFLKFERLQKDNMNDLNTKFQTLEQMAKEVKSETQKLQIINESSIKKLFAEQEKQGNELYEQIKQSIQQINANFNEKLNATIPAPYSVKNVVVIKQVD